MLGLDLFPGQKIEANMDNMVSTEPSQWSQVDNPKNQSQEPRHQILGESTVKLLHFILSIARNANDFNFNYHGTNPNKVKKGYLTEEGEVRGWILGVIEWGGYIQEEGGDTFLLT